MTEVFFPFFLKLFCQATLLTVCACVNVIGRSNLITSWQSSSSFSIWLFWTKRQSLLKKRCEQAKQIILFGSLNCKYMFNLSEAFFVAMNNTNLMYSPNVLKSVWTASVIVNSNSQVSSVNMYDPPMDVVAARDHITHLVYQLMQPQVLYERFTLTFI